MISVAHVITDLHIGGAQSMLLKLLQHTDRSRVSLHVFSLLAPPGVLTERVESLGIPVDAIGIDRRRPNPVRLGYLATRFRRLRPDVIQTWMYHSDLAGGLAAKLALIPAPVVWNIRQSTFDVNHSRPRTIRVARLCAQLSSHVPYKIVCCSNVARRVHVEMGFDDSKIEVIPNGFDPVTFRPDPEARIAVRAELGLPADTVLIGMMARRDPQKDHHNFVAAAARLHARMPNVHFVLCGDQIDCANTELMGWIDRAGIRDVCHLLGERKDVSRITAALDLATLSSAFGEGFPNVLGEAMACEVPCVATDIGDSAYVVGDAGRIVPPRDPDALASAWSELLSAGSDARRELGQRGRQRVLEHFSIDSVARKYEETWRSALASTRRTRQPALTPT